jgi:hypothetical protein
MSLYESPLGCLIPEFLIVGNLHFTKDTNMRTGWTGDILVTGAGIFLHDSKATLAKCASAISNPTKPEALQIQQHEKHLRTGLPGPRFSDFHTAQRVIQNKRQLVN